MSKPWIAKNTKVSVIQMVNGKLQYVTGTVRLTEYLGENYLIDLEGQYHPKIVGKSLVTTYKGQ